MRMKTIFNAHYIISVQDYYIITLFITFCYTEYTEKSFFFFHVYIIRSILTGYFHISWLYFSHLYYAFIKCILSTARAFILCLSRIEECIAGSITDFSDWREKLSDDDPWRATCGFNIARYNARYLFKLTLNFIHYTRRNFRSYTLFIGLSRAHIAGMYTLKSFVLRFKSIIAMYMNFSTKN